MTARHASSTSVRRRNSGSAASRSRFIVAAFRPRRDSLRPELHRNQVSDGAGAICGAPLRTGHRRADH